MEQDAVKQMEVQARLFKPYGPSVQGANKQMRVKTRPFKPSLPSVLESLPSVLLDGLPDALLNDKTDVLPLNFLKSATVQVIRFYVLLLYTAPSTRVMVDFLSLQEEINAPLTHYVVTSQA